MAMNAPKRAKEDPAPDSGAILIIDDEAVVREAASGALSYLGYTALEASSAEEGLEILRRNGARVLLVILDVSLPGMGSRLCLERLREMAPGVRVVLVSGLLDPSEYVADGEPQVCGFLPKPFRIVDLQRQIRAALGGE
jgi:two-component system, cell cycle sensor histidine kinase and response regulator CckA